MFYKFISDPFSTSQFVFDNGRQCRAGRQKVGCNRIWGLQNHQPPILRREGLSAPRMAVSICISGQLFHKRCKSGALYSPVTQPGLSTSVQEITGETWRSHMESTRLPNCTQIPQFLYADWPGHLPAWHFSSSYPALVAACVKLVQITVVALLEGCSGD